MVITLMCLHCVYTQTTHALIKTHRYTGKVLYTETLI